MCHLRGNNWELGHLHHIVQIQPLYLYYMNLLLAWFSTPRESFASLQQKGKIICKLGVKVKVKATQHHMAVMKCRRGCGYKSEAKQVVTLERHNLENGETFAGFMFS